MHNLKYEYQFKKYKKIKYEYQFRKYKKIEKRMPVFIITITIRLWFSFTTISLIVPYLAAAIRAENTCT
jgi:hypothetical protein